MCPSFDMHWNAGAPTPTVSSYFTAARWRVLTSGSERSAPQTRQKRLFSGIGVSQKEQIIGRLEVLPGRERRRSPVARAQSLPGRNAEGTAGLATARELS